MMGWEKDAYVLASFAAWAVVLLVLFVRRDVLFPFLNLAQRAGMTPGTPEYFATDLAGMLAVWFVLRDVFYPPTL